MLVQALEIARKWARKSFSRYQDAPIWVQPLEAKGKAWVAITTFRLKLAVPGTIDHGFRLDARDLDTLKGELVVEERGVFLVRQGARKRLPAKPLDDEDVKFEAGPEGILHPYIAPFTLPADRLEITVNADDFKAVITARSKDNARPALTGIGLVPQGLIAASDGYQMVISRIAPFENAYGWLKRQGEQPQKQRSHLSVVFPDAATNTFFKKAVKQVRFTIYRTGDGETLAGQIRGFLKATKVEVIPFLMWADEVRIAYPDVIPIAEKASQQVLAREVVLPEVFPKEFEVVHLVGDTSNHIWLLAFDEHGAVAFSASIEAKVEQRFWLAVNPAFLKNARSVLSGQPLTMTTHRKEDALHEWNGNLASPFRFQGQDGREVVIMPIHTEKTWEALVQAAHAAGINLPSNLTGKGEDETVPAVPVAVPEPVPA